MRIFASKIISKVLRDDGLVNKGEIMSRSRAGDFLSQ